MRKLHFSLLLGLSVFATACVDIYKGPESIYNQDLELVLKPSMTGWNKEDKLTAGIEAGLFIDAPGGGLTAKSIYPGSSNLPLKLGETVCCQHLLRCFIPRTAPSSISFSIARGWN